MKFASAALLLLTMAGCGSSIETDGFDPAPCDLGVSNLSPAMPVDYVAFIEFGGYFGPGATYEDGTVCATATDGEACEAAVEAPSMANVPMVLVTTTGDTVAKYTTPAEVVEFLGTVDTQGEAVLVARFTGFEIECAELESGAVREVDGGYEVIAVETLQACDPEKSQQVLLRVGNDGSVEVLDTASRPNKSGACP